MRSLIALMAIMAIVGMAGAWEETNYLNYQFNKVVEDQAGEHLDWFNGVNSYASFYEYGPYGYIGANVQNYANSVYTNPVQYEGQTVDTKDVLTQYGSAVVGSKSPDLQTPGEVMTYGTATAGQNMALSGLYNYAQFSGSNYASIYGSDFSAYTYPNWYNPSISISSYSDSLFTEANMGTAATIGYEQLMAPGAYKTMSGGYKAWGDFAGAYDPTEDDPWSDYRYTDINVDLSGAGSQHFYMYDYDYNPIVIVPISVEDP